MTSLPLPVNKARNGARSLTLAALTTKAAGIGEARLVTEFLRVSRLCVLLSALLLFGAATLSNPRSGQEAEGALSFYLPGFYGDFGVAYTPEPGHYWLTTNTYYAAKSIHPILPFETEQEFEGFAYLNLIRGFWIMDSGGFLGSDRFALGVRVPIIHIDLDVTIDTPIGVLEANKVNADQGDFGFIPAALYWQFGNLHLNLYETVTVPTGIFNRNDFAHSGRS